jgi:hypothetical protein
MNQPFWLKIYNQFDLFNKAEELLGSGKYLNRSNTKIIVGQYFELLTSRIFTGLSKCSSVDRFEYDFVMWNSGKLKNDIVLEVKSTNREPIIDSRQMQYYSDLESSLFPYTNAKVYYVVYFYKPDVRLASCGSVHNLVNAILPQTIQSCAVMPLSLIKKLIDGKQRSYGKWSEGDRVNYFRWGALASHVLTAGRANVVQEFLKDKSYIVRKIDLPPVEVLSAKTVKFPVIFVHEADERFRLFNFLKRG